jgi:hypothetical protein
MKRMKGGVNKMTKEYQDQVNRTFELYGSQIGEALEQLRRENPDFGRYEFPSGDTVEARYDGKSVTGISFIDVKLLEAKVQELTDDPEVRLMRTDAEYRRSLAESKIARFKTTDGGAELYCEGGFVDDSLNRVHPQKQNQLLGEMFGREEEK